MPDGGAVLVTGGAGYVGTGYVGSHVLFAPIDAGYRAVVLNDPSAGFRGEIADGIRRAFEWDLEHAD